MTNEIKALPIEVIENAKWIGDKQVIELPVLAKVLKEGGYIE